MLCCGIETSRAPGKDDWFTHCLQCKRIYLQPVLNGFKYFKVECPPRYLSDGSSVPCKATKSSAHPFYRIPIHTTDFTCEECFREFLVEETFVDELSGETVHKGPLSEHAYYSALEEVKAATKKLRKIKAVKDQKKEDLKMKMAYILRDTKAAEQMKKQMEMALQTAKKQESDDEKLEQLEKTNGELKRKIDMLIRLKEVRKAAPEITLPLMEIANIKREINRVRPLQEAEQKKAEEMEMEYLEKKEEFETVVARHNVILKQHMKLEKKKDVCDKARNDYSKLEEERNAKLKVAKIMFEEEKAVLDHKNGELSKMLDVSAVKVLNLIDEIKDLQKAQERQRQVPLFQLLQVTSFDADSILEDLKKRAEMLRGKDAKPNEAVDFDTVEETVDETGNTEEDTAVPVEEAGSIDFSVPLLPSSGSSHVDESPSEGTGTEMMDEEEFYETSSEDSFELIKNGHLSEESAEEADNTVESDDEAIQFD